MQVPQHYEQALIGRACATDKSVELSRALRTSILFMGNVFAGADLWRHVCGCHPWLFRGGDGRRRVRSVMCVGAQACEGPVNGLGEDSGQRGSHRPNVGPIRTACSRSSAHRHGGLGHAVWPMGDTLGMVVRWSGPCPHCSQCQFRLNTSHFCRLKISHWGWVQLWGTGPPQRPPRVWRRGASYPQRAVRAVPESGLPGGHAAALLRRRSWLACSRF